MSSDEDKDKVDSQHQWDETHALQDNTSKMTKQIHTNKADRYTPEGRCSISIMQYQEQ